MSHRHVPISAPAALRETTALAEHYRNRNLILAEQLAQADDKIAKLQAELAAAKQSADPPGDATAEAGEES